MVTSSNCPSCHSSDIDAFYEVNNVPINSVLLLKTRDEAINFPKGQIKLGFCRSCGFIFNQEFNPKLVEYSSRYEATQGYSPSFNSYLHNLAVDLVERFKLHNKQIIEIGCGQGEFLTELCEIGDNQGIGFDPVYEEKLGWDRKGGQISFIKDYFSEKYSDLTADFICCRMTLEHIQRTYDFVSMISKTLGEKSDSIVFFQVPDIGRILRELAFWDVYYEHCSYFSRGSLARLFRKCGFDILDLDLDYDDQYINIIAKKGDVHGERLEQEDDLEYLSEQVLCFRENSEHKIKEWREKINLLLPGKTAVIWGASSKGVSFLTTLKIRDEIRYAVDINPRKQGTFIAGTGQEIISPEQLKLIKPEAVIVMNPIYIPEITGIISRLEIYPEIFSI